MTIEELSQLSDDERDLKVAEKLGATWKEIGANIAFVLGEDVLAVRGPNESIIYVNMPCYSTSRDAIHEAVSTITDEVKQRDFVAHLWEACGLETSCVFWTRENFNNAFVFADASARQRAIAFLMV